ncbi:MAG TPA: peptide-methionine (R)-S-oxide reductase MsrB [Candidatus Binatia bacterium]|nr:peptide-methionine (R)-S-oxide reductase MsrB [Candidatus Binatia bacterium]
MKRRSFLQLLAAIGFAPTAARAATDDKPRGTAGHPPSFWQPLLPAAAFDVLFHEDTERAFSSPLYEEHRPGTFVCAACYLPLFEADKKYASGTGWPSFWQALPNSIATRSDRTLFFERTEYHCLRCGGHHGHRFDDGPQPTGLRYCNNGVALRFVPKGEALPALRG